MFLVLNSIGIVAVCSVIGSSPGLNLKWWLSHQMCVPTPVMVYILPQEITNLDAPVDSEVEAADEAISENHMLLAQHNSALLLLLT